MSLSGEKNHRNLKILLIAVSVLATLWVQAPRLADRLRVDADFQSLYWMNKFQEQGLYPDDQLRGYRYVTVRLPWGDLPLYFHSLGHDLLFYVASFFVSPPLFSKLLPLVLMPVTVWYVFEYGMSVGGRNPATVLGAGFVFLNLASTSTISVISGLQRSFVCPLMIALLYYLHRGKLRAAATTVLASALIYPPAFLLGAATSGLFFLALAIASPANRRTVRKGLVAVLVAFCIGALVLSPVMLPRIVGALDSDKTEVHADDPANPGRQVLNDPKYQPGGRAPLFATFPVIGRGGLVTGSPTAVHLLILMAISGLICLRPRARGALRLPGEILCMLLASLGLFAAAWASIWLTNSFLLYQPSRYTHVGLFLFFSILVFLNIGDAIKEGVQLIHQSRNTLKWLIAGVEAATLALILLYPSSRTMLLGFNMKWLLAAASLLLAGLGTLSLARSSTSGFLTNAAQTGLGRGVIGILVAISLVGWGAYARAISKRYTVYPAPAERELLAFLETLPKDSLLAGTPWMLDNIPLFAKRQILFSSEYLSQNEDLMREALDAYYAEEVDTVLDFCKAHGVDYLVIHAYSYAEDYIDEGWIFFEPYNQELLPRVRDRESFALAQVPDAAKVFESDGLLVVPCTEAALR